MKSKLISCHSCETPFCSEKNKTRYPVIGVTLDY